MEDVAEPTGSASASSAAACPDPPVHPTGSRRKSRRRKSPVHRGVLAPAVPDALMISKEEVEELEDAEVIPGAWSLHPIEPTSPASESSEDLPVEIQGAAVPPERSADTAPDKSD